MAKRRIRKICGECGGTEVMCDAWAEWCEDTQQWVLKTTFQQEFCADCDGETSIKDVVLKGE